MVGSSGCFGRATLSRCLSTLYPCFLVSTSSWLHMFFSTGSKIEFKRDKKIHSKGIDLMS